MLHPNDSNYAVSISVFTAHEVRKPAPTRFPSQPKSSVGNAA